MFLQAFLGAFLGSLFVIGLAVAYLMYDLQKEKKKKQELVKKFMEERQVFLSKYINSLSKAESDEYGLADMALGSKKTSDDGGLN